MSHQGKQRAILVRRRLSSETGGLEELRGLARTAGYEVVAEFEQVREPDPRYNIGLGKAKEIAEAVKKLRADKVIFDNELKVVQIYNLAKLFGVEVIDRLQLILEIFSKHASTTEAKLQIELARLRYELAHAREKVRLAKMGEQPGFYGLGRYEVDVYYNAIKRRIASINATLRRIRRKSIIYRQMRREMGYPLVSLAGYTNAGKTELFNALAHEQKLVSDALFTTLSTTTRLVDFAGRRAFLTDTVGFIERLPILLVEAFKTTLEETVFSDLIILVVDAADELEDIRRKALCSLEVLGEIGASDKPLVVALNKIDLITRSKVEEAMEVLSFLKHPVVPISAKRGTNLDVFCRVVAENLPRYEMLEMEVPSKEQSLLSHIHSVMHVLSREDRGAFTTLVAEAPKNLARKLAARVVRCGGSVRWVDAAQSGGA